MTDLSSTTFLRNMPVDGHRNGQAAHVFSTLAAEGMSAKDRCVALGIDWLDEAPPTEPAAISAITADIAVRLRVVPIRFESNRLLVAMVDPLDIAAADEVAALTGKP